LSTDIIRLTGLQFYAYHGATDGERENGQRFEIDVELRVDFSEVVDGDMSTIVDYVSVYDTVREIIAGEPYEFLETLVRDIAQTIRQRHAMLAGGRVRVRKSSVPLSGIICGGSEAETSWLEE
jgi:dihydroneopterin aldolase